MSGSCAKTSFGPFEEINVRCALDLLKDWWQQRMDRQRIIQLRHDIDHLHDCLSKKTEGLRPRDQEYQHHVAEFFADLDCIRADIAELETKHMKQRATYWRVPIPQRPYKREEESEYWEWHDPHGAFYLSENGMKRLRREVHHDWEMWSKPWLSFMAVGISLLSLLISVLGS